MDTIPWRCYCLIEQSDLHWWRHLLPTERTIYRLKLPEIETVCIDSALTDGRPLQHRERRRRRRREMAPRPGKLWKKLNKSDLSFHWNCLCLSVALWKRVHIFGKCFEIQRK